MPKLRVFALLLPCLFCSASRAITAYGPQAPRRPAPKDYITLAATDSAEACADMLSRVKSLFAAKDPALLTVDILARKCSPAVLYQSAYYQGFAFYLMGSKKDALADLELARTLSGPWDEQILFYIWRIKNELKDKPGRAAAYADMKAHFPLSKHLPAMEAVEHDEAGFSGMATTGFAYLTGKKFYHGPKSRSFLSGGWTQEEGEHRFQEFVNLSGNFSLDGQHQDFYGGEAGAEYRFRGFTAQASLGPLRSSYDTVTSGLTSVPPVRKLEKQTSLMASQIFPRGGGWDWTASANYYRTDSSFTSFRGLSFSSLGFAWDLDRYRREGRLSWNFRGEYQTYNLGNGCYDNTLQSSPCEATRLAAAEGDWEKQVFAGRNVLGAEAKGRVEAAVDTSHYKRLLGTAGVEYAFHFNRRVKFSSGLDGGLDWDGGRPDRVVNFTATLSARF